MSDGFKIERPKVAHQSRRVFAAGCEDVGMLVVVAIKNRETTADEMLPAARIDVFGASAKIGFQKLFQPARFAHS